MLSLFWSPRYHINFKRILHVVLRPTSRGDARHHGLPDAHVSVVLWALYCWETCRMNLRGLLRGISVQRCFWRFLLASLLPWIALRLLFEGILGYPKGSKYANTECLPNTKITIPNRPRECRNLVITGWGPKSHNVVAKPSFGQNKVPGLSGIDTLHTLHLGTLDF